MEFDNVNNSTAGGLERENVIYGSVCLIASVLIILGNAVIVFVIGKSREMHSPTLNVIAFMAVFDILLGLYFSVFVVPGLFLNRFPYPWMHKGIASCIQGFLVIQEMLNIAMIVLDRFIAVAFPLKYTRVATKTNYAIMTAVLLLMNACKVSLQFVQEPAATFYYNNPWVDLEVRARWYLMVSLPFLVVPFLVIVVCSLVICRVVLRVHRQNRPKVVPHSKAEVIERDAEGNTRFGIEVMERDAAAGSKRRKEDVSTSTKTESNVSHEHVSQGAGSELEAGNESRFVTDLDMNAEAPLAVERKSEIMSELAAVPIVEVGKELEIKTGKKVITETKEEWVNTISTAEVSIEIARETGTIAEVTTTLVEHANRGEIPTITIRAGVEMLPAAEAETGIGIEAGIARTEVEIGTEAGNEKETRCRSRANAGTERASMPESASGVGTPNKSQTGIRLSMGETSLKTGTGVETSVKQEKPRTSSNVRGKRRGGLVSKKRKSNTVGKTTTMVMLSVFAFCISFFPRGIVLTWKGRMGAENVPFIMKYIAAVSFLCNSLFNVFIYTRTYKPFRKAVHRLFCKSHYYRKQQNNVYKKRRHNQISTFNR